MHHLHASNLRSEQTNKQTNYYVTREADRQTETERDSTHLNRLLDTSTCVLLKLHSHAFWDSSVNWYSSTQCQTIKTHVLEISQMTSMICLPINRRDGSGAPHQASKPRGCSIYEPWSSILSSFQKYNQFQQTKLKHAVL